jgi:hypothetical protein
MVETTVPVAISSVSQGHVTVVDAHGACVQPHLETPHPHLAICEVAERGRQLGEQPVLAVQQHHADVFAANARVVAQARVEEIDQLARRFDTREPAADHDEAREPTARLGIRLQLRLLEPDDDPVAQEERIAQRLERQRVGAMPLTRCRFDCTPIASTSWS